MQTFDITTIEKEARKSSVIVPEGKSMQLPLKPEPGITLVEITQKSFSRLSLSFIHDGAPAMQSMTMIRIFLEREANLESFFAMIGGATSSLFIETHLEGDQSQLCEKTIFFGNGDQIFNMFSNTLMKGKHTQAVVESKGILTDRAQARFDGNIHIFESAKQSNARLNEHTLLLSPEAKMNAIPGLKIDTNDVIATHSASMTRIDDEQLFYASSRGIEEREAVRLIAEGFLAGVYSDLPEAKTIHPFIQEKICRL